MASPKTCHKSKPNIFNGITRTIAAVASGISTVSNSFGGLSGNLASFANGFTAANNNPIQSQIPTREIPQQNGGFIVGPNGQLIPVGAGPSPGIVQLPPGTSLTPLGLATLFPLGTTPAIPTQAIPPAVTRLFPLFGLDAAALFQL